MVLKIRWYAYDLYGKHRLSCLNDFFFFLIFPAKFKLELQAIISACRITRTYVDQIAYSLIRDAVIIKDVSVT